MTPRKVAVPFVILLMVIIASIAITTKNSHDRAVAREAAAQKRHNELLVEVARDIESYWHDYYGMRAQILAPISTCVCILEEKYQSIRRIQDRFHEARWIGKPISPEEIGRNNWKAILEVEGPGVARGYVKALLDAYGNDTMAACDSSAVAERVYFGRNSYTLLTISEVLNENNIPPTVVGLTEQGVRPLAIELLTNWITNRKAGRNPRADNSVEYVARQFGISNFDVGCHTDEDTRKYFREILN